MAPGSYIVDVYAADYQTGTAGAIVLPNETTTVDVSLQPNPGTIVGTVTSAQSGLPISGALVEVSLNNAVIFSILTDSSGNYSISGISPDSYIVDAYAASYQARTSSATVSSNQTTQVNFSLQSSPGIISGTVISTMSTSPIPGALVEVNLNNTLIFSTLTDGSGNYSISGLAPNTYAVHAHAITYQTAVNSSVTVVSNITTTANFSLQSNPGAVKGTITDSVTGLPLSGVFIDLFEDGIFVDVAVTDSVGNYSVTGLAADSYTLIASKVNYDSKDSSFTVTAGETTTANLTLIPNFPPRNLTGAVIVNAFLLQADRIHHLQWVAALGGNVANYRIYRNGALVAIVSPNDSLQYDDHNRSSKIQDNYAVTAVNTSGNESASVSIVMQ
jgi:protocatechuate 3,4-dioxygenase beta subunit